MTKGGKVRKKLYCPICTTMTTCPADADLHSILEKVRAQSSAVATAHQGDAQPPVAEEAGNTTDVAELRACVAGLFQTISAAPARQKPAARAGAAV